MSTYRNLIGFFFVAVTPWGRIVKIIVSLLSFITTPIGPILLWSLLRDHGISAYAQLTAAKGAKRHGLNADYEIEGRGQWSLVDKAKQTILIGGWGGDVVLLKFSDIQGWEWQWVDRNGTRTNNYIAFRLQNEETPIINLSFVNAAQAEVWHQRFSLILPA